MKSPPRNMCDACLRAARVSRRQIDLPAWRIARRSFSTQLGPPPATRSLESARLLGRVADDKHRAFRTEPVRRGLAAAATNSAPAPAPASAAQAVQPLRAIVNPRADATTGAAMHMMLTPRASARLAAIAGQDARAALALRITVESGGCHGFQYVMALADLAQAPAGGDDTVFEADNGARLVVDESSLELLSGSTVDYTSELIGSQFKVTGIPGATSSCGCGTSFDLRA